MKDFLLLYSSRFGITVIAFVADVIVSRSLGPAQRGEYYLFITIITQISLIATMGYEYLFPGCKARGHLEKCFNEAKSRLLISMIIAAVGLGIVFGIFNQSLASLHPSLMFLMVITILMEVLFIWFNYYLLIDSKVRESINMRYFRRVVYLVILVLIWKADLVSLNNVLAIYVFSLVVSLLYVSRTIDTKVLPIDHQSTPDFKYSLLFIKVFQFTLLRGVVYLMVFWKGAQSIGELSIALAIVEVMLFLPNNLALTLFSNMGQSEKKYLKFRKSLVSIFAFLLLLQSIVVYFISEPAVLLLYGQEYIGSIELVRSYCLTVLFISPVVIVIANSLRYNDYSHVLALLLVSIIIMFVVGSIVIDDLGVTGCVFAQGISCMMFLLVYFMIKKGRFFLGNSSLLSR